MVPTNKDLPTNESEWNQLINFKLEFLNESNFITHISLLTIFINYYLVAYKIPILINKRVNYTNL